VPKPLVIFDLDNTFVDQSVGDRAEYDIAGAVDRRAVDLDATRWRVDEVGLPARVDRRRDRGHARVDSRRLIGCEEFVRSRPPDGDASLTRNRRRSGWR
jgi:hypothetical protein